MFLNSALRVQTSLTPLDLLRTLKTLEAEQRVTSSPRWGPREIDVDILLIRDTHVNHPDLTVPHPFLLKRSFAFYPALELCPEWIHPGRHLTLTALSETLIFTTSAIPVRRTWWEESSGERTDETE